MKTIIKRLEELSSTEIYEILELRQNVFVIEQQCIYPDIDGCDDHAWHLLLIDGGVLAGYLRILDRGQTFDTVAVGRVAVRKEYRSRGMASLMMEQALEFIFDEIGENTVKLSAQQYLTKFYESYGFKIISEGYLEDGIPHIDMEKSGYCKER